MAKRQALTPSAGIANQPLQAFLIELAVNDDLRGRFNGASDEEQRTILADEFQIGDGTIDALLSGSSGRVKARLRFSDQQGNQSKLTPARALGAKSARRGARKR